MTEPYHTKDSPLQQLPQKLRFILETLIDYKKSLHKMTYQSQSPQIVNVLMEKLDGAGVEVLNLLHSSSYRPNYNTYPELAEVFNVLREPMRQLPSRDKFILERWIEQMFFQNPLTVNLEHIENLAHTYFEPQETLTQQQNVLQDEEVQTDASREMS